MIKIEEVYKKYPKMFPRIPGGCGDGWGWLLDSLCTELQHDIDYNDQPQIVITSVKEKWGNLTIYTQGDTDVQFALIQWAERLSQKICEQCGTVHDIGRTQGWIKTLCRTCAEDAHDKNTWEPNNNDADKIQD